MSPNLCVIEKVDDAVRAADVESVRAVITEVIEIMDDLILGAYGQAEAKARAWLAKYGR